MEAAATVEKKTRNSSPKNIKSEIQTTYTFKTRKGYCRGERK